MHYRPLLPLIIAWAVASALHATAQETAADRHAMAIQHLKQTAARISDNCLVDVDSLPDWEARRPLLRQQLLYMLGLDPMPTRTPLKPEITGQLDREHYVIEKVIFQSLPELYVTGNLYLPKVRPTPVPVILYLCGHSPHPFGAKTQYQDRAAWFAANGFACLILDTLEFGEVAGIHHGTHNLNMWHWLSLGYTPAGVEVWNAIRAIDYLETRPEVDARRLGMTGISGGGAITWYTAAVDDRVAASAPVCSTFTFGSQAAHWLASGQCDCIYYHNTFGWDFPIVAALIAPRPLLILSGQKDPIFPPDGYHEVFQRARRVYNLYSRGNAIREVDADVGHSDPPLFLNEARAWMRQWLGEANSPNPVDTTPNEVTPANLACLQSLPADAANYAIQDYFTAPARPPAITDRSSWQQRRTHLMGELMDKTFRWFPEKVAFETRQLRDSGGYMPKYCSYKSCSFQSEAGVRLRAQLLLAGEDQTTAPLLIYVKRPGDSIYAMDMDELLPLLGRLNVLILYPRFTETSVTAAEHADIERTAAWLGRTMAGIQIWDVMRTIDWAIQDQQLNPSQLMLYGKGDMSIVALYAALMDERVQAVVVNNPPHSHWKGPALLNCLRITDIVEVAGALAPRQLISIGDLPVAFAYTKEIYTVQSAADSFRSARSLPEAVDVWRYPIGSDY